MRSRISRSLVLVVCLLVVLGAMPGVVVAQSGVSGSIVVDADETVSGLEAVAGSVVVYGTVDGDLSALAGDVTVAAGGRVTGDVSAAAGSVRIAGTVDGDVNAAGGDITVADGATIAGSLNAGAGNVRLDGTVGGDATVGADTIVLGPRASVGGDLTYDGDLRGNRGAVAGTIERDSSLGGVTVVGPDFGPVGDAVLGVYAFLVNVLLGVLLLVVAPTFSRRVADRALASPVETGGVGLLALVLIPIGLVVTALTIIGIPLTIVGALLFALLAWMGGVYGRFVVGSWLLEYTQTDSRWVALGVGFLVVAIAVRIPYLGWLFDLAVFLLGLGAVVLVANDHRVRRRQNTATGLDEDPAGEGVRPA